MESIHEKYEVTIGLEVHVRLLTDSKLFSNAPNHFASAPNTNVDAVTLAHPGTLPFLNEKAILRAIALGMACQSDIASEVRFERKHYFYPDLPRGYQISQLHAPVCSGGFIPIDTGTYTKKIRLNRIHLEEDAGKSIHDQDENYSLIDLNRAGTPLLEIVTEPDLHHPDEAWHFLYELRKLVRYLDVCDGNMEEGSMRCDANISVKRKEDKGMGTKVEVKNLNSLRFLKKAIQSEVFRQIQLLESGKPVQSHTRGYHAEKGSTFVLRSKEEAEDYRYFPEPDLPPVPITMEMKNQVMNSLPELPFQLAQRLHAQYALGTTDVMGLTEDKRVADYFLEIMKYTSEAQVAANWMLGTVRAWLNQNNVSMESFPIKPRQLAALIDMISRGEVSHSAAVSAVFEEMIANPAAEPRNIVVKLNLFQNSDVATIQRYVTQVVESYPEKVKQFHNGKKGLTTFFMGEIMKASGGKLDPRLTNQILTKTLINKKAI
ncbi:MAG: aspartyl/glutamyl-tRNA(Asn/Gln) amidotransferase subunit B [Chitinophagales bacterium]|nr:MAG: aspartyl/glutamyl-tRNA(Asn/Gln) amidotransferase subunit B [Chitinophagales bacterium]